MHDQPPIAAAPEGATTRPPALPALTGVRIFAAMAVLLYHYGAGFSERIHAPKPISHFLHNGFLGVSLFFVLSGFIMTYAHFSQGFAGPVIRRFYWARVARIYPVYALALVLALPVLTAPLSFPGALAVLTMTQSWTPTESKLGFSWVMQAWTLSIEAAFYILFPFYWPWVRRLDRAWTIVLALACAALIVAFAAPNVSPGGNVPFLGPHTAVPIPVFRMAEFTYGMALCQLFVRRRPMPTKPDASDRRTSPRIANIIEIVLALGIVAVMVTAENPHFRALFTVLAGLFIVAAAHGAGVLSRLMSTRAMLLLGGASYGIYILQQPVHSLCSALIRAPYDQFVSPVATIAGAIAVYLYFEQPAQRVLMRMVRKPR